MTGRPAHPLEWDVRVGFGGTVVEPTPLERRAAFEAWCIPGLALVRGRRTPRPSRYLTFHGLQATTAHVSLAVMVTSFIGLGFALHPELRVVDFHRSEVGYATLMLLIGAVQVLLAGSTQARQGGWDAMAPFDRYVLRVMRARDVRAREAAEVAALVAPRPTDRPQHRSERPPSVQFAASEPARTSAELPPDLRYHRLVPGRPYQSVPLYPPGPEERKLAARMYVPGVAACLALFGRARSPFVLFHMIVATLGHVAWLAMAALLLTGEVLLLREIHGLHDDAATTLRDMSVVGLAAPLFGLGIFSLLGALTAKRGTWSRLPLLTGIAMRVLFKREHRRAGLNASAAFLEWAPPPLRTEAGDAWPGMKEGAEPSWLAAPRVSRSEGEAS